MLNLEFAEFEAYTKYLEHQCGGSFFEYWIKYKWKLAADLQGASL